MDQLIEIPGFAKFIRPFFQEGFHGAEVVNIDGSRTDITVYGHSTEQNAVIAVAVKFGRLWQPRQHI